MEASNFQHTTFESRGEYCPESINIFQDIARVLIAPTRRDKRVDHDPDTVEKATLVHFTAAMLGSGLDDAKALLDAQQKVLHETLVAILESPDPIRTIEGLIIRLDPENKKVRLHVAKDGQQMLARDLNVVLDPRTLLLETGISGKR